MAERLNPKWADKIKQKVSAFGNITHRDCNIPIDEIISYAPACKFLIELLAQKNISFTIINLGCGVKRITTKTNICTKCNGTGKC